MTLKRNIRRVLFVLGGLVALLLVASLVILFLGRTASPPLPNPNGYTDLLQAGQTVSGNLDNLADRDRDGLRALMATNAEALRLLRVGLSRECSVPTDAVIANLAGAVNDLPSLKSLARLLNAEGRLAEMENRPADAAQSYLDGIRLGSKMCHGGMMINRLVGIACEGFGSTSLAKLLPKLTCDQMRPLIEQLEQIDAQAVTWKEVLRNENRFARAQMRNFPNPIAFVSAWWLARDMRKACEQKHHLAAARIRLLTVELALRCSRCDEGNASADLQHLLPKYLHRMPTDPFTGRQLVYKQTGTNWLLYSVGPDRVDNGGKPLDKAISGYNSGDGQKRKGDVLFDSPW
jgi:hypothetical protein